MTDRDRLIELLKEILPTRGNASGIPIIQKWDYGATADKLLTNGVIVPPCKVGDTVYQVDNERVYESTIKKIVYDAHTICFDGTAIGHSIFLTKEEAEAKLKELKDYDR